MKFSASGGWFGKDWYGNVEEAAKYGFKGVEDLRWTNLDLDIAKKTLDDTGITSTALLIRPADQSKNYLVENTHGLVWEDARDTFIESFCDTLVAAKKMNVPNIVVTTGNERFDISREKQFDICVDTLKELSKIAEKEGIMIVLEPLNVLVNHKGYYLVTTEESVRMIKAVDSPKCKILFDIYHQQVSEGNLINNIRNNIDYIGHFHIADHPGRKQPGTGEINYSNVFKAIQDTGYNGWLAFECGRTLEVPELCCEMQKLIEPFAD